MTVNRQIILAKRPEGMPDESNLVLQEGAVPECGDGQVLVRTIYLSLDPYMRGRMSAAKSYAASVEEGAVMEGGTVGQVVESRHPDFNQGDYVLGRGGWQEYSVEQGKALRKLDPAQAPISTAVGVLGMPGFTAYAGLEEIGKPQKGETVVVSAAAGAVGQVVGQIAKMKGCRVVGVAGAEDKCRQVVEAYGFDACVNYKDDDFEKQLAEACPNGIDVYFENVGGKVFDAVMGLVNDFARIPVCGRIAHYNDTGLPPGPDRLPAFMGKILVKRLLLKGFIQFDYIHRAADFQRDMSAWIREGKVKYQEDVVEGLENTVSAFQGLLQGKNRGKLLIQVGEDPTR
ncbi:NADP-dependent oxidoreductase [Alloalcanivorax xenomutans]|jgi:NADPH-dependent curcumin reductase|uniref:NADP-dependent oxidoreductase n=1 Tax=Alloalcanivorax xenomutans TaxID=1094342 RepID=A0A9Q3W4E4_9GAMM|nr:NADP-dependent oxidoreductase [Alloalcanivorax xenomutans]ERS15098.1 2-alkenal reductase [Alcanivorax sp. PN-3]KYZ87165.1 NADP-dependent oxidoreductase [Alcanivorax sp. KX64203]MBA4721627.1 NADP-dependent oxidoreductase [Alcanivorax sp.]ARB45353.1 NADP-dependent oxidoreductase [Alloalcanivorax xenomutans]MCE7507612.1 NADP-dependent oxidoreductase [Alloalcanivorax xenomutans]